VPHWLSRVPLEIIRNEFGWLWARVIARAVSAPFVVITARSAEYGLGSRHWRCPRNPGPHGTFRHAVGARSSGGK
jgi:hypothetical protein